MRLRLISEMIVSLANVEGSLKEKKNFIFPEKTITASKVGKALMVPLTMLSKFLKSLRSIFFSQIQHVTELKSCTLPHMFQDL